MEFKRICPNCGKELMYKSETSYKNAIKSNTSKSNVTKIIKTYE